MSDFDASALMAALDATEEAGVPAELVEQLRAMVVAEDCRRKMTGKLWSTEATATPLADIRAMRLRAEDFSDPSFGLDVAHLRESVMRSILVNSVVPAIDGFPLGGLSGGYAQDDRPVASPLRSGLAGYLGDRVTATTRKRAKKEVETQGGGLS